MYEVGCEIEKFVGDFSFPLPLGTYFFFLVPQLVSYFIGSYP